MLLQPDHSLTFVFDRQSQKRERDGTQKKQGFVSGVDIAPNSMFTDCFFLRRSYHRAAREWVLEDLIPGTQVAARVARSHDLWILGIVVRYVEEIDSFEVEDEDEESDGR
jgi:hypothetical protein